MPLTVWAFSDVSDTSLSFMAVVDQASDAGGRHTVDRQSAISSYLLEQGKVIVINQYQILDPARDMTEQLNAARAQARNILKELDIKQGVPWTSFFDLFPVRILLLVVTGGLVGGLIGRRIRNRKKNAAV